jgi:hypothetical protein
MDKTVSKRSLDQFIALDEGNARCKRCGKGMTSNWWRQSHGYCYNCSVHRGMTVIFENFSYWLAVMLGFKGGEIKNG